MIPKTVDEVFEHLDALEYPEQCRYLLLLARRGDAKFFYQMTLDPRFGKWISKNGRDILGPLPEGETSVFNRVEKEVREELNKSVDVAP